LSRAQESQAYNTAATEGGGYYNSAQNSYKAATGDISDYQDQLAKYKASNPYVQGGQFQTETNKVISNTNDAAARAAGESLQGQALRTGQNSAGAVAATEKMEQRGARDTSAQEAEAAQKQAGLNAQYNQGVLGATAKPAEMETTLAGQQARAGNVALETQQKAGEQPNWWDEFGEQSAASFGKSLGQGAGAMLMG
jgi:hypothetical protein